MMEQFVLSFPFLFIYFLRQTGKSLLAQSVMQSTFFCGTQKMNVLRIYRPPFIIKKLSVFRRQNH